MPDLTLYSPDISCEHCIATINDAVSTVPGARFLHGDHAGKRFTVSVESGAVLDKVTTAVSEQGYPLGEAAVAVPTPEPENAGWTPNYRVTRTDLGADVNYDCPCSCESGASFDRSATEQELSGCCCGRQLVVGMNAEIRLKSLIDTSNAYRIDTQEITMPWGQMMQAALAIPTDVERDTNG